ncbi:MAG: phosphoribosylformylglycinamidine cyclo-ligase [Gammaproteobacteria bacterium]|tara:strand:- start:845 stop:1900 length:1056 start_codon:yes stop_codon:yes gene_type:complete
MPKKNNIKNQKVTYKNSGVSIENADKLINKIKPIAKKTFNKNVIGNIGGFGALYDISRLNYKKPVLVSGTDGVGTKLKLAVKLEKLNSIGIDLVAMCVNDIISQGAKPLFFLDYYSTSNLEVEKSFQIIKGIAKGCEISGTSLIGGETAEMPKVYKKGDFDIAGFCVGVIEKKDLLPKKNINAGDCVIGIKSSGFHSNGYSLLNNLISKNKININETVGKKNIGTELIKPTKIYTDILNIKSFKKIKAIANITGGGLTENIPRVLPENKSARLDFNKITMNKIFQYIQKKGNVDNTEMLRVFNCGVGMILIVKRNDADLIINELKKIKLNSSIIGDIINKSGKSIVTYLNI